MPIVKPAESSKRPEPIQCRQASLHLRAFYQQPGYLARLLGHILASRELATIAGQA